MRELVGELMLTRARLELSAREFRRARQTAREYQEEISAKSEEAGLMFGKLLQAIGGIELRLRDDRHRVSNLISELDGVVRELRMVPLSTLLRTYPVAVHSLARELGREVRLEFDGDAVEVDRAVLDRLADPLLHLIRNAVDHGIEPPEQRVRAGKRKEGRILLRARLHGQQLDVEIIDDGAGISVEVVRARAVELGFCDAAGAQAMSDEQVLRTLFQSGMSTRREVTKISGRGIGLDVVLRSAEELGGSVTVRTIAGQETAFHQRLSQHPGN
jgi:chemotaxis protein histidine kinase CheA